MGLGERIENLALTDEKGVEVAVRKLAPGEFVAGRAATQFRYDLKLEPPAFASDAAHVSWLSDERGLLMLGDMLPAPPGGVKLKLALPANWGVATLEAKNKGGEYVVEDAEAAVFMVGLNLRERRQRAGSMEALCVTSGEWAFSDADLSNSVGDILKDYEKVSGGVPRRQALILLLPFPRPVGGSAWSAETRGGTLVFLSNRLPSKIAALVQLNGSLTHELFHLWVPNGLALDGDYAWFYEGFTNYQALRAGMRQGQLTFQDYLNALGRAFDGYRAARGAKEISLLEASERRWLNGQRLVYNKGMLVAFLYDLTLMQQTEGKLSLDDAYRELFRRHAAKERRQDGNRAIMNVLSSMRGMGDFAERYIQNPSEVSLVPAIEPFGLRVEAGGISTHVSVASALSQTQRDLLRKLGYNEKLDAESRKLHQRMKKSLP
jgi:predicted metalloprotease with PDZ domain